MSNTEKNLATAFAGESQANRKYLAFAKQAELEGYPQVAKLFRATAEAETIHALAHLKAMGGIKSTAENLKAAITGETYEFSEMYPPFIQEAEAENNTAALRSFKLANEAEKVHAELYQKYLDNLEKKEVVDLYLCTVCGHINEGKAPEKCPICGAKAQAYKKVD
ncbi:Rubrerythrin [Thermosinus carboxydivorans Nor1]|uniref:Rubrerythrin n=1 Tax=Thermosinus carboxydivorans Nor1 TaxID=401526 RepID=A1HTK2_9FIRM|nr:rubrerythrin family protein [Thermosinus carboxydivorans]EAX46678.1 Rubrerythrin [Thermosinus carboxydivorans Nor1]